MGARLQGAFKAEDGTRIGVTIDDSTYSGTVFDFECLSLAIEWRGDDAKERFSPIIGSEAKISILVNNADLEDFITDLVGAVEGRFTVTVGTNDGINVQSRWCGYITTDLATIEDVPLEVGYAANLSAVDGLGVLKGVKYSESALYPYTGYATIIEHLLNCINELGFVATYYGSITPILRTVCNWHANEYTYATSINPLSRSRVNHTAFYYLDNKGNKRFRTCYEVLEAIATAWGARILFSGGSFWFIQVNQYSNPAANTVFTYLANGTEGTDSATDLRLIHDQANPTSSDLLRFSGGVFSFFAPLSYVEVNYQHIQTRNLLAGQTFVNGSPVDYTYPMDLGQEAVTVLSYSGNMSLTTNYQPTTFESFYVTFKFRIRVGAYYLVSNQTGGTIEWTTSAGDYYVNSPVINQPDFTQVFSISFVAPELPPAAQGAFIFAPSVYKAYKLDFTEVEIDPPVGLGLLLSWELFNNYMEVLTTSYFDEQSDILRYSATNNSYATKEAKITTSIGDGPNSITPGHIEVLNNSSSWVSSTGWRVGNTGTFKPFSQLLVNEMIRGQLITARRFQTSFKNLNAPYLPLQPHVAIYYGAQNWVCQSFTWDLNTNIGTGEWYMLQTGTGFTENDVEFVPEGSDSGPSTSAGSGSTGSGGGGGTSTGGGGSQPAITGVNVYSQEFLNTTSASQTITVNNGSLPTNEAQIKVYMNGQKLLQSQWSVSGSTITIDSNTHYDTANYEVEFIVIS